MTKPTYIERDEFQFVNKSREFGIYLNTHQGCHIHRMMGRLTSG